ncbi:MAG: hypothetical protein JRI50_09990 [Deltaproteobacteria bacterium]|nr:hypothetical protein [Deltaproteobacteria bacterium]MBW2135648.1 hypothetical protein [Deltaproteobacteria bacterium]
MSDHISIKNSPYRQIAEAWNRLAPSDLPRVEFMGEKRQKMLAAATRKYPDLGWWEALFTDLHLVNWYSDRMGMTCIDFEWVIIHRAGLRKYLDILKKRCLLGGRHLNNNHLERIV